MSDSFIKRIIKKPPFIFPWVALFHLFMLLFTVWSNILSPFPSSDWIEVGWILGLTTSWIFVCDLKKWAAISYVLLAVANTALHYLLPSMVATYTFSFFEPTLLFSFFILFYFRAFGK
jgi:hypothetical protein